MGSSVVFWVVLAILLFWALGAYNRLVRLRGQVLQLFAGVDARLGQMLAMLEPVHRSDPAVATDSQAMPLSPDDGPAGPPAPWAALQGAGAQCATSLHVARKSPLNAQAIAALKTACATLQAAWERLQAEPEPLPAGVDPDLRHSWGDQMRLAQESAAGFNGAVAAYNAAIAQFPAVLLAYLFGFKPGGYL